MTLRGKEHRDEQAYLADGKTEAQGRYSIVSRPQKGPSLVLSILADPTSFMREQMLMGLPSMRSKQVWLSW